MPQGERTSVDTLTGGEAGGGATGAMLELIVGKLNEMERQQQRPVKPRIPWEVCHPVWFTGQIPLTAGAGTLLNVNLYGPELPYWWDLRVIDVWGWSAGTVTIYNNAVGGQQFGVATVPGEFTWGAQHLLAPQDSLVFGASGITGVVNMVGQAIEVQSDWLPEYLM